MLWWEQIESWLKMTVMKYKNCGYICEISGKLQAHYRDIMRKGKVGDLILYLFDVNV